MTEPAPVKKKCFVVMGFGEKTDFATGRTLDLDKTYRTIIKKAVEEAGLECIRADNIIHAGIIDKPMYELLYNADVVIADLSTSNANAIYELGVRHALKPRTTIVMAEKQFKFPFDIGHLVIRPYEHLGKGIDAEEADKVREELKKAIITLIGKEDTDSPVYTFLPTLKWPTITPGIADKTMNGSLAVLKEIDDSATIIMDMFKEARKDSNWALAISCLKKLLEKRPADDYLKQQLALATYKSKLPSVDLALAEAKKMLETLNPSHTTDPETLGLWGAVHKRLWEVNKERADLDEAIWAYEKGFFLKNDFYNGINFAFLLNVRAAISDKRNAVADVVIAERVRKKVIAICNDISGQGIKDEAGNPDTEQLFWLQATLVEAYLGTGEKEKADALKAAITLAAPEDWMVGTMNDQLEKLSRLLENTPALE